MFTSQGGSSSAVQSGSNEHGSWVKFSDGTIIQSGIIGSASSTTYYTNPPVTFPIPFTDKNSIHIQTTIESIPDAHSRHIKFNTISTTGFVIGPYGTSDNLYVHWFAIGK